MNEGILVTVGLTLILLGILTVFAGIILSGKDPNTTIKGGGVVFLGPIPLIFGTDRRSAAAISIIALILMVLAYSYRKRLI